MADGPNETYSLPIGLTFLFNLLLGTGVLTMPLVFKEAGYVTGVIVITALCFMSYIQVTFLVEAMANANFVKKVSTIINASHGGESARLLDSDTDEEDDDDDQRNDHAESREFERRALIINDNGIINALIADTADVHSATARAAAATAFSRTSTATDFSPLLLGTTATSTEKEFDNGQTTSEMTGEKEKQLSIDDLHLGHVNASFEGDDDDDDHAKDVGNEKGLHHSRPISDAQTTHYGTNGSFAHSQEEQLSRLATHNNAFNILEKFELGDMTNMFLRRLLSQFFFLSIIIYLFGDLMIYNTMMSKSMREISCTSKAFCNATNGENPLDAVCWDGLPGLSRRNAYRIYLLLFVGLLLPLIYAGLKKTQSIQVITIILRWLAFFSMVGISLKIFIKGEATGQPEVMNLRSVPKMFGICIYSFMCHHSVPSILTPVKKKRHLLGGLTLDYLLVSSCYLLIALTGIFAFGKIEDVYTLNFQINDCPSVTGNGTDDHNPGNVIGFDIFLPTYPIFTLFSSYTMIALTLINNMKVLARNWTDIGSRWVTISFPLIAMVPSMLVSLFTEDVAAIVSYVGSYAGGLIQYVFPCLLVFYSRRIVKETHLVPFVQRKLLHLPSSDLDQLHQQQQHQRLTGDLTTAITSASESDVVTVATSSSLDAKQINKLYMSLNRFASPFQSTTWIVITAVWWVLSLILVTVDHLVPTEKK